ncbi:hypothetical protein QYF36_011610 [Acer negundo]|nr:hypothetical protein QYF36_011610 [Acer negundo]
MSCGGNHVGDELRQQQKAIGLIGNNDQVGENSEKRKKKENRKIIFFDSTPRKCEKKKREKRKFQKGKNMIGVGKIKQYSNVLDKPLSKGKQEVSLSAFAFLFSELVQYNQTQVDNIAELERRLEDAGYAVGARVLELLCHREKGNRRETRLLGILSFVHSTVWKVLFGKVADSLEKGTEHEDEYMISEKELLVNRFISIPKDMGTFNCGAFAAGIVRGVLDGAGFPAVVTAHFVPVEGQQRPRTTILIKFAEEVLRREARLG